MKYIVKEAERVENALMKAMEQVSSSVSSADVFCQAVHNTAERLLEEQPAPYLSRKTEALMANLRVQRSEGGSMSSNEVAAILSLSRQAVDERRKRKKLVAWRMTNGKWRYPVWQFGQAGTRPGIEGCLAALEYDDQASVMDFFLLPSERLEGKRPLDLIRAGATEKAVESARSFGIYG